MYAQTEIAQLLHKIGDVFKTLWGKASVIESSAFDKDCLRELSIEVVVDLNVNRSDVHVCLCFYPIGQFKPNFLTSPKLSAKSSSGASNGSRSLFQNASKALSLILISTWTWGMVFRRLSRL